MNTWPDATAQVITKSRFPRYDRHTCDDGNDDDMAKPTAEEIARIEARLNSGEWLRPGEVAAVLDTSRSTVVRMLDQGTIGFRLIPGSGKHRECDPADVRAQLAARRTVHRGEDG